MLKIAGIILNVLGVLALWFGGVPYKSRETVVQIGGFKADMEVEKRAEIPPQVGAGAVALGTVLLLFPVRRKG